MKSEELQHAESGQRPKYLDAFAGQYPPRQIREWMDHVLSFSGLTRKELEIVRWILAGYSDSEIAKRTGNTEKTCKHHWANARKKFDVGSRAQLFAEIFGLAVEP
jgi:DNA-binding CsgD family transcriptional regulator